MKNIKSMKTKSTVAAILAFTLISNTALPVVYADR